MTACPQCQRETVGGAYFCHSCGGMLRAFCRPCRLPLPTHSAFCYQCGTPSGHVAPISTNGQIPTPIPTPIAPTSVSANTVSTIEQSADGERKLVSIVFADISGFTAMSERMDAEKVTDLMNACFDRLGRIVFEYKGYIDKFMGDCIMALFGAPTAHENDPELAVRCALKFLEELEAFNRETGNNLRMSIGINSGMVIAGSVGTEQKREYTVMGDSVNIAQRLQSFANPGQIIVSKNIQRSCEKDFSFNELDSIHVKGKEEKIEVFEVLGTKKDQTSTSDSAFKLKSFVGRKRELEIASRCVDSIESGQGQILAVSGDPGVGKSRLKREIKVRASELGIAWHETKSFILTKESAYHNFKELISSVLQLNDHADEAERSRASEELREYKLDSASEYLIRELIALRSPDLDPVVLDAQKKKKALFLAVKKFFVVQSTRQKIVLYLEDLHWMDSLSLELLHYIVPISSSQSIMFYASFRPEFTHDWSQHSNFNQIGLSPLQPAECLELVREILDTKNLPSDLEKIIIQRSDGNPLYIEEILKSLIETESLIKTGRGYVLASGMGAIEIPSTVQGLIASRIDKLDETEKMFIQYASIIGREFSAELLDLALGGRPELEFILNKLKKRELIHERHSEIHGARYIFKHALTQEVAYNSILKKKRRLYHERVAIAIEHLSRNDADGDRSSEHVVMLAHHYFQAEITPKAVHYLKLAGDRLKESFNYADASKSYLSAIELIEATPDNPEIDRQLILELYYDIAFLKTRSDPDLAEKYFRSILIHPEAIHDPKRKARAFRALSEIAKERGNSDEALELQNHAIEISRRFEDLEGEVRTLKVMGNTLSARRESSNEALNVLQRGLDESKKIGKPILIAEFLNDKSILHIDRNELDAAENCLTEAIATAKSANKIENVLMNSMINMGVVHYYRKNYIEALKFWEESVDVAKKLGDLKNYMIARHNVGEVLREFEKYDEALAAFQESYQTALDLGYEPWVVNNLVLIGHLSAKKGKDQEGVQILNEALRISRDKKYWAYYCDALFYLGAHYQDKKDFAKAKEAFEIGLAKANELKLAQFTPRFESAIEDLKNEMEGKGKYADTSHLAKA